MLGRRKMYPKIPFAQRLSTTKKETFQKESLIISKKGCLWKSFKRIGRNSSNFNSAKTLLLEEFCLGRYFGLKIKFYLHQENLSLRLKLLFLMIQISKKQYVTNLLQCLYHSIRNILSSSIAASAALKGNLWVILNRQHARGSFPGGREL